MSRIKRIISLTFCFCMGIAVLSACTIAKTEENHDFTLDRPIGSMKLEYAKEYSVDYYQNGCSLVTISGEDKFLVVPEDVDLPGEACEGIVVIKKPINNIYIASSSVMDMFKRLDSISKVSMTSTKAEDYSDPYISEKVNSKEIEYIGKYSSPDYERLVSMGCDLAIENTMIGHKPEAKEQLERLNIPVLVEKSSYEEHPLGRVEWIKLYGLLCDKEDEANDFMEDCSKRFEAVVENTRVDDKIDTAFFYISSNGYAIIRKPGDYISRLIEISGGRYVFNDMAIEEDNALSTVNLQMETFYDKAVNAKCLIYNSTIIGEVESLDDFVALNPLLSDFTAVREGNVYCTNKNMFQESTAIVDILEDFNTIFADVNRSLRYLHKLQ